MPEHKNINKKSPNGNLNLRKPEHYPSIRPPSRKTPGRVSSPFRKPELNNVNIEKHKKHPHKLGFHAQDFAPPSVDLELVERKMKGEKIV